MRPDSLAELLLSFGYDVLSFIRPSADLLFLFVRPSLEETSCSVSLLFCYFFQHLKADLMRQFDTQVNEFMDSLIEESASLGSSHVSTVFPLSDKEKSKLRY